MFESGSHKRSLLAGLGWLALALPALAGGEVGDYNFNETTGLINIPVARVAPAGSVQLSLGAHNIGGKGKPFGLDVDDLAFDNDGTARLIAGLPGRVEISVMPLHGGVFKNNHYVFGAKWLAVPDAPDHPAFAIGVQSLNSVPQPNNPHPTSFDTPSAFGVVSHSFPINDNGMALDLHAGIGTGRLRNGFAGGEVHVTPEFSVLGETDGTIESAGFRFTPSTRFEILTTAQFQDKVRFGFLLSYRFGPTEPGDDLAEQLEAIPDNPGAGEVKVVTPEEIKQAEPPVGTPESAVPSPNGQASLLPARPDPAVTVAPEPPPVALSAPETIPEESLKTSQRPASVQAMPAVQRSLTKRERIVQLQVAKRDTVALTVRKRK